MKGKKLNYMYVALALMVVCGRVPAALAVPITVDTLNYQGAVFNLKGEWDDGLYRMTYTADFNNFQDTEGQSYLNAIDWKWEGAGINSVFLAEAPGGVDDWKTQTFHQISSGDSSGCEKTGGANAVCTEFLGDALGLSVATDELLSWVFEISFKNDFNNTRQRDMLLGRGVRTAFVNDIGRLTTPIMSCENAEGAICSSDQIPPANVPSPGVPALLIIGLGGLWLFRRGKNGVLPRKAHAYRDYAAR